MQLKTISLMPPIGPLGGFGGSVPKEAKPAEVTDIHAGNKKLSMQEFAELIEEVKSTA